MSHTLVPPVTLRNLQRYLDLVLPLADVADGYRAMDDRRAIKSAAATVGRKQVDPYTTIDEAAAEVER